MSNVTPPITANQRLEVVYLKIRVEKFYWLKFVLEAYDGLAILSSSGIDKEIVLVRYPVEMRNEVFFLLSSLARQLTTHGK